MQHGVREIRVCGFVRESEPVGTPGEPNAQVRIASLGKQRFGERLGAMAVDTRIQRPVKEVLAGVRDELVDPNHWVSTLAPSRTVLDFWPGKATPVHLEALASAPPEAWEGSLGAARKVLRALIARRVTVGHFEELVVEGDAFAGEFEPVADMEWLDEEEVSDLGS